jgi:Tfp pilus assembly protein FimT
MTLIELLVVLTILSLMAGLVLPRMGPWLDTWRLRSAADRIAQTFRYARTRALFEQHYYVVEILPHEERVRVLQADSGLVREFSLPEGIQVQADDASGNTNPSDVMRFFFPPSGAVEERDLVLRSKGGRTLGIHLGFTVGKPGIEIVERSS